MAMFIIDIIADFIVTQWNVACGAFATQALHAGPVWWMCMCLLATSFFRFLFLRKRKVEY